MDGTKKRHLQDQLIAAYQIPEDGLVCLVCLDFVHICRPKIIFGFSAHSMGSSGQHKILGTSGWGLIDGAGAEMNLHPPLQELSESQGRGFQSEPGCGCFLRMGTQKNSKNLIPGMLSALLHADSSHKNQTVHLDPRM